MAIGKVGTKPTARDRLHSAHGAPFPAQRLLDGAGRHQRRAGELPTQAQRATRLRRLSAVRPLRLQSPPRPQTAGLSQERLGSAAELHRTEVGLLERGARVPRIDTLVKVATALGIAPTS